LAVVRKKMLLEVSDFRCYKGRHAILWTPGAFTLLAGESGAGKTTLLLAVEWCLYGIRAHASVAKRLDDGDSADEEDEGAEVQKPKTGNATWVRLSWNAAQRLDGQRLVIKRVKGNNKIFVDHGEKSYEGISAQNIIIRLFGSPKLWRSSSYIPQKDRCALLVLPSKKDVLIELGKLAYQGGGGFGVSDDDFSSMTPEMAKARIDSHMRALEKRLIEARRAVTYEEGTMFQFLQSHPEARSIAEMQGEEYSPREHASARAVADDINKKISLYESLQAQATALRAELEACATAESVEEKIASAFATISALEELSRARQEWHTGAKTLAELEKTHGARTQGIPRAPKIAAEVLERYGELSHYPETHERPNFPTLHDIDADALRYASEYERAHEWFSEHFPEQEFTCEGVSNLRDVISRETRRKRLAEELEKLQDGDPEELERLRTLCGDLEQCDAIERSARARIDAHALKFGRAWHDRAHANEVDARLLATALDLSATFAPRGAEASFRAVKDPAHVRNDAMRLAFAETLQGFETIGNGECPTIDQIKEYQSNAEDYLAACDIISRREEISRQIGAVRHADDERLRAILSEIDSKRDEIARQKALLDYSDPVKCPCCSSELVISRGALLRSDGSTRDARAGAVENITKVILSQIDTLESEHGACLKQNAQLHALERKLSHPDLCLENIDSSLLAEMMEKGYWKDSKRVEKWRQLVRDCIRFRDQATKFMGYFSVPAASRPDVEEYLLRKEIRELSPRHFEWLLSVPAVRTAWEERRRAEARAREICEGLNLKNFSADAVRARCAEIARVLETRARVASELESLGETETELGADDLAEIGRALANLWLPLRGAPERTHSALVACVEADRAARAAYESEILRIRELEVSARRANIELRAHESALEQYKQWSNRAEEIAQMRERVNALLEACTERARALSISTRDVKRIQEYTDSRRSEMYAKITLLKTEKALREDIIKRLDDATRRIENEVYPSFEIYAPCGDDDAMRAMRAKVSRLDAEMRAHELRRACAELYREYEALVSRLESRRAEENLLVVDVEHCKSLRKLAEVVETRMLEQVIAGLNSSLEEICPLLFKPGESLYLTLTKQNASNEGMRTVFEIHLIKNGHDITLEDISGGEGDRASFALTLALADLPAFHASPMILLDECMGSLNTELREQCIEAIKEYSQKRPHKTIIAVDHFTLSGLFDEVKFVEDARVYRLVNNILEPCLDFSHIEAD